MPATYENLATTTLTGTQAEVTFSSISGNFTDLVLISNARWATGSASASIEFRVNGDTGTNYSYTYFFGNGSSAQSGRGSNTTTGVIGTGTSSSGSDFGLGIAHFQNYSNTATNKTIISRPGDAAASTQAWVNLWRNTAAITSITLRGPFSFVSGSTFTLYGIKAA